MAGDGHRELPSQARLNLPYSYTEQKLDAVLKWRAARATSVKGGIEWTDYKRTFSEVEDAEEITILGGARYTGWQTSSLSFDVSYADRDAGAYVGNRPFRESKPAGTTSEDDFENHPSLRKYNQFDRERTEARVRYDWFPNPQANLGVTGLSQAEKFDANSFGLNEINTRSLTIDGGWYPNRNMALTGFITRENWETRMSSRTFTNATPGDFDNPDKNWRHDTDEEVDTFNLHLAFKDIGPARATNLGVSYTLSNLRNDVATTGGSQTTTAPLPNLVNKMQTLKFYGGYRLNDSSTIGFAAEWSKLNADDFAVDDVAPNTMANVLSYGQTAQSYDVVLLSAYWRHEF